MWASTKENLTRQMMEMQTTRREVIWSERTISMALVVTLSYHFVLIVLLLLGVLSVDMNLGLLLLFMGADTVIWFVCLIPMMAVGYRLLDWNDPLFWTFILLFGMSCSIFVAYLIDPVYVTHSAALKTGWFIGRDPTYVVVRLAQAQFVVAVFAVIVLFTNRYKMPKTASHMLSDREARAAATASFLLVLAGLYGFIQIWSSQSFAEALVLGMGSIQEVVMKRGNGRFFIMQSIAISSIPLGIVGFLHRGEHAANLRTGLGMTILVEGLVLLSVAPMLVFGSRLMVIFTVATSFSLFALYGIHFHKWFTFITVIVVGVVLAFVTLFRGNPYVVTSGDISSLDPEEVRAVYAVTKESPIAVLLDLDRIGPIAFILDATETGHGFLYGETLAAGFAKLATSFSYAVLENSQRGGDVLAANEVIATWRTGRSDLTTSTPPSYAGELWMQMGLISLVIGSLAFGGLFAALRRLIRSSSSSFAVWFFFVTAFSLAKYVTTEFSEMLTVYIMTIPPVILAFWVCYIFARNRSPLRTDLFK
jgi:hypothetical protein